MCGNQAQEDTLAALNRAIEQNPQDSRAIARRGETCRLAGRYEEALADFSRAIALQPDYAWAIAHRGETYYLLKRYREALADFNRAVELNPTNAWTLAHRGVTLEYMRRYQEALADLNRAIELLPDYAWALIHRARTYEQIKCYERGLEDFDRALALDRRIIGDWQRERGLLFSFLRRYAEAIEYYEQALQENPQDYFALYGVVSVKILWKGLAETQTEINEVRSVLLSLVNTEAGSDALYGLGGLAALEGKTDQALNYLQEAISLNDYRADTAYHDLVWLELVADPRFQALIAHVTKPEV